MGRGLILIIIIVAIAYYGYEEYKMSESISFEELNDQFDEKLNDQFNVKGAFIDMKERFLSVRCDSDTQCIRKTTDAFDKCESKLQSKKNLKEIDAFNKYIDNLTQCVRKNTKAG